MLDRRRGFPSFAPVLLTLGLTLGAAGCGSVPPRLVTSSEMAKAIQDRGLSPDEVVVPYLITDEMRAWVRQHVPDNEPMDRKLELLLEKLVGPGGLKMEYAAGYTGTAQEVFESRRANCLAFTSLFVGLAREAGVPVYYLDVEDVERFEKEGDLVVVSGHVSAGYGLARELRVLDFSADAADRGTTRKVERISDMRAIALFHSNRGAELLRVNQDKEALNWLRKAVALDPDFVRPWINYGVALRRTGDLQGAEEAYRKALELDPSTGSAYQNLASLLRQMKRDQEAEQLLALTAEIGTRNPYSYLALGDLSFSHGRYEEARRFYRRALRLQRDSPEPYAAMGLLSLAVGDSGDAERWLRKAVAIDQENGRVKRLSARIQGSGAASGNA